METMMEGSPPPVIADFCLSARVIASEPIVGRIPDCRQNSAQEAPAPVRDSTPLVMTPRAHKCVVVSQRSAAQVIVSPEALIGLRWTEN
jgi:hypothetical protein